MRNLGGIGRRDVQALDQRVHPLCILFNFVDKEGQLGDNPRLVTDAVSKGPANFFFVMIEFAQHGLLVLGERHADVDLGQAEVGADTDVNDGDENIIQQSTLIALEDVAEFFLNKSGKLLLSYGASHGVKIGKGECTRPSQIFGYLQPILSCAAIFPHQRPVPLVGSAGPDGLGEPSLVD